MKSTILLFFCLLFTLPISAQVLKGKITDTSGETVPDATIYIQETAQGITADDKGNFRTTLKKGRYTCEFSSLGYERKIVPVDILNENTELNVELEKKIYAVKEVIISSKREDPAYSIMRKAIAMAPFYLHQIKEYESETYVKGTVKVEKIPAILKLTADSKELKNIVNKLFVIESQNEVTFKVPNTYEQKVLAFSSSIPADIDADQALEVMTANIYDPKAMDRISPLAPGAFNYYKFTFEGMTTEGQHIINKIRVRPKMKNSKLVSGWLYIIENTWNVKSADLSATEFGITVRFTATYNEVRPDAFLPTAYDIDMKLDLMGMKASGKYYSSVQYKTVELNESIVNRKETENRSPTQLVPEKSKTKKQQKARQKLEALAQKEQLTTREAYKMAKLMQDAVEPDEKKKQRESLEIISDDSQIKVTADSLAQSRDSLYWDAIRDLPLRKDEIVSYQIKDSLKTVMDSLDSKDSFHNRSAGNWIGKIITGESFSFAKKYNFGYSGLLQACPQYNFADGFWLGQRFTFNANIGKGKSFFLAPSVYYTTARRSINWQIDGIYKYAPFRNGYLSVSGGHTTADFNGTDGTLRLINSLSSLIFGENPVKFYENKFILVSNTIELTNGMPFTAGISYEKRNALENRQSYNFFGNKPSSNLPHGQVQPMPDNRALKTKLRISYTPRYHYRNNNGRKVYAYSYYPTLSVRYDKGIPAGSGRTSSFDKLEGSIAHTIKIDEFNRFDYSANIGKFLSSEHVYFPDFKHFNTNELFITGSSLNNSFSLLDNYAWSTDKQWLQAHLNYTSGYLLFKRIPFLQSYLFNESLHARTLWVPGKNYMEFGYSAGFDDMAGIGIFVGLNKGKYDAIGFTISLPILKSMGAK